MRLEHLLSGALLIRYSLAALALQNYGNIALGVEDRILDVALGKLRFAKFIDMIKEMR